MLPEALNHALFEILNATRGDPMLLAALRVVAVALIWLLPGLLAGLWLLGGRKERHAAATAGLAGCLAMAIAHAASAAIDHPRPFALGLAPNLLDHADDSSFPSDHTTLFLALAAIMIRHPPSRLPGLGWSLAGLGLVVGCARIALGVHFPLDVIGAIAIGVGAALATDLGLARPATLLFELGEVLRRDLRQPDGRGRRETRGSTHAHPPR